MADQKIVYTLEDGRALEYDSKPDRATLDNDASLAGSKLSQESLRALAK